MHEVITLGQQLFESRIAPLVSGHRPDDFLAIDVLSGDFETDEDDMTAEDRLRTRQPDADLFVRRVGDVAAHLVGGGYRT